MQVAAGSGVDDAQAQRVAVASGDVDDQRAGHGVAALLHVAGVAQAQRGAGERAGADFGGASAGAAGLVGAAGEALGGGIPQQLAGTGGVTVGQACAVERGRGIQVGAGDGLGGEEVQAGSRTEHFQRGAGDVAADVDGARERAVAADDEGLAGDRADDFEHGARRGGADAHAVGVGVDIEGVGVERGAGLNQQGAGRAQLAGGMQDGAGHGVVHAQTDGVGVAAGDVDGQRAGHGVAGHVDVAAVGQAQHAAGEGSRADFGRASALVRATRERLGCRVPQQLAARCVTIAEAEARERGADQLAVEVDGAVDLEVAGDHNVAHRGQTVVRGGAVAEDVVVVARDTADVDGFGAGGVQVAAAVGPRGAADGTAGHVSGSIGGKDLAVVIRTAAQLQGRGGTDDQRAAHRVAGDVHVVAVGGRGADIAAGVGEVEAHRIRRADGDVDIRSVAERNRIAVVDRFGGAAIENAEGRHAAASGLVGFATELLGTGVVRELVGGTRAAGQAHARHRGADKLAVEEDGAVHFHVAGDEDVIVGSNLHASGVRCRRGIREDVVALGADSAHGDGGIEVCCGGNAQRAFECGGRRHRHGVIEVDRAVHFQSAFDEQVVVAADDAAALRAGIGDDVVGLGSDTADGDRAVVDDAQGSRHGVACHVDVARIAQAQHGA